MSDNRHNQGPSRGAGAPSSDPPIAPEGELSLPCELGHYRVTEKLGSGGMGAVYLAYDPALNRKVALKVLHKDLAKDANYMRRFLQEAQSIAKLTHPGIIGVYYIGRVKGLVFFAMEYVEGETLSHRLKREGRLDAATTLRIGLQVSEALAYALEMGLIHRDIKPANLFMDKKGRVKVGDFGLAKNQEENLDLTRSGSVVGSPYYMSPEQGCGKRVDRRSDIYSLGATMYHLLAGAPPFTGDTPLQVMMRHVQEEVHPIESLPSPFREVFHGFITRMMAKSVEDRFQTYADVAAAIRGLLASLGESEESPSQIAAVSMAQPVLAPGEDAYGPATGGGRRRPVKALSAQATASGLRGWRALSIILIVLISVMLGILVSLPYRSGPKMARSVSPKAGKSGTAPSPAKPFAMTPAQSATPTTSPIAAPALTAMATPGAMPTSTVATPAATQAAETPRAQETPVSSVAQTTSSLAAGGPGLRLSALERLPPNLQRDIRDDLERYLFSTARDRIEKDILPVLPKVKEPVFEAEIRKLHLSLETLADLKTKTMNGINENKRQGTPLELGPDKTIVLRQAEAVDLVFIVQGKPQPQRMKWEDLTSEQFFNLARKLAPDSPEKQKALWTFARMYGLEKEMEEYGLFEPSLRGPSSSKQPAPSTGKRPH